MKIVAGRFNLNWIDLTPGDLVRTTKEFYASWPPDGSRRYEDGNKEILSPRITSIKIKNDNFFIIISHVKRISKLYQSTSSIIFYDKKLWWVGTSSTLFRW